MDAPPTLSERALDLLADALDCDPAQREAFVEAACAGDAGLLAEIRALLAHEPEARAFLETPAFVLAGGQPADVQGELKPGDVLGDCAVIRLLGEGGMGEVYLAQDNRMERPVAVKLLKRHLGNDGLLRRFQHERKVLAGLTHPGIARLYGWATTPEERSYLVMEFVEGERLDHYCDTHGLDVSARLTLFRKVCAAVTYAHQNLVVHRDLKPANILVTAEGEPKLLDFGIAKLLDPDPTSGPDPTMTMAGALTPAYASPEQVRGEPITTATDVYSLGVILYELLTGRRPFHRERHRPDQLAQAICEQEPERPSTVCAGTAGTDMQRIGGASPDKLRQRLAGDLDNIVAKAMRKDPARRYASVAQFAEDVRRHVEGLPVTARPDTFLYRTSKFVRRNKPGVALAALVVLALVGGLISTIWEARRAARRFEDVRRLANSILFEIEPKIAGVSGTTAARSLLAQRALEYLDGLSREAGGDRELRRELAASYERVGDVQGNPAGANLGDLKGGLVSYAKARAIRQALAAAAPGDARARHELANNEEQIGTMLWWSSDTPGALANYRDALALRRALLAEQPGSADFRAGFASVEMRLADVDTWSSETAKALDDLRQALPVLEGLRKERPTDDTVQVNVARCLARIGVAHREAGDYVAAYDHLHRAEAIMEPLVQREPDNRPALLQYCFDLSMETEACNDQNTPESTARALELAPRLIHVTETQAGKDPNDITVQHNLATAYDYLGVAQLNSSRWQDALVALQHGLSIDSRLAVQAPENAEYLHSSSYFHTGIGEAKLNLGQLDAAAGDAETAQQLLEKILAADPSNTQAEREVVTVLILRGRIDLQRQRQADARRFFQRASDKLAALKAKKITNHNDAEDSAFLNEALGDAAK